MKDNNITICKGSIFNSNMQTITNTVNCVGMMGAGLALKFKKKFSEMYLDYKRKAEKKEVKIGYPYLWVPNEMFQYSHWILNFPTKYHWKNKSKKEWIEKGLQFLVNNYKNWGITSIAIPALGCNLGGLNWSELKPLLIEYLSRLDIPVEIYQPKIVVKENDNLKNTQLE